MLYMLYPTVRDPSFGQSSLFFRWLISKAIVQELNVIFHQPYLPYSWGLEPEWITKSLSLGDDFSPWQGQETPRAPQANFIEGGQAGLKMGGFGFLLGGLEHFFKMIFHILGRIVPTDELIFFRGVGIPPTRFWSIPSHLLTGAFYAGLLDGLLGVAGMMKLIVSQWIPENSKFPTY